MLFNTLLVTNNNITGHLKIKNTSTNHSKMKWRKNSHIHTFGVFFVRMVWVRSSFLDMKTIQFQNDMRYLLRIHNIQSFGRLSNPLLYILDIVFVLSFRNWSIAESRICKWYQYQRRKTKTNLFIEFTCNMRDVQ